MDKIRNFCIIAHIDHGKSTLADVLMGLLLPDRGQLRVDGQMLDQAGCQRWRRGVAYVPQDCFLFNDTIRHNLLWADDQASDELYHILYDGTVMDETGCTVLGGQAEQITEALGLQRQFDVSNNSWGATTTFGDNFNSTTLTFAYQHLRTGVEDGRGGKGTVFVFAAGNSGAFGDNTNYHNFQNAREVITVAAGFPTTVAPVIQFGAVPVFVDVTVDDGTYNIDVGQLDGLLADAQDAVTAFDDIPFTTVVHPAVVAQYGVGL